MKRQWSERFLRGALCGVLIGIGGVAHAALTVNWESPLNNQDIAGIQQFRGFAFSDSSTQPLSVKLTVTSPFTASVDVPWGSARADVGTSNPQLNSGFGITVNAGNFSAGGTATITLEVREAGSSGACAAPTCRSETRTFTIAKPGGRAGDANNLFAFLNDLDLGNANLIRDGDDIIAAPVSAVDSGSGGTRLSTLRLQWIRNSQSFGVVDAASGASFSGVQSIFTNKCAFSGCHGANPSASLSLSSGSAFTNVINKSVEDPNRLRVNPGNSTASYLYQKIIAGGNITGGRMPLGGSPLSDSEINTIKAWIDEGAPPPQ